MPSAEDVKNQLKAQTAAIVARDEAAGGSAAVEAAQPRTIRQMLEDPKQQDEFRKALAGSMDPVRFARVVTTTVARDKKLQECNPRSLIACCMLSAQLGLELGGPLGHAYPVPFWNSKANGYEVQFILGYKGIIALAHRSPAILSVEARLVYENDPLWKWQYGLEEKLEHREALSNRGEIICGYMLARFKGGGHYFVVAGMEEIEEHRARSQTPDKGPWLSAFPQMCRKTLVKIGAPFLPLTANAAAAISLDETMPDYAEVMSGELAIEATASEATSGESMLAIICETCGGSDGLHVDECPERQM